ncbi:MAG: hypothetical protein KF836_14180 [Fimbriimonadaceae bacterium]|nr:hypothetical protein [Fimbriimonadaceae bacterium]
MKARNGAIQCPPPSPAHAAEGGVCGGRRREISRVPVLAFKLGIQPDKPVGGRFYAIMAVRVLRLAKSATSKSVSEWIEVPH